MPVPANPRTRFLRPLRNWGFGVAVAAMVMVGVTGCAGGDDTDPDPDRPAPTEQPGAGDFGADDLASELSRLAGLDSGPIQVVYEWDAPHLTEGARMTIAQDPPNRVHQIESEDGTFLLIAGDSTTYCMDDGSGWQCIPGDLVGGMGLDPDAIFPDVYETEDFEQAGPEPDTELRNDTILGRAAICVSVPEAEGVADAEACFDQETGIMLRATGTDPEGTFLMEAVEVTDPDPDLFVPPADPIELPGN